MLPDPSAKMLLQVFRRSRTIVNFNTVKHILATKQNLAFIFSPHTCPPPFLLLLYTKGPTVLEFMITSKFFSLIPWSFSQYYIYFEM